MILPNRQSIRLPGYDYSQYGYYFVTICTQDRQCLFGDIVGADPCVRPPVSPMMKLNNVGKMVNKWLIKIPERFIGSSLDIYQIMPNHIHIIIVIENPNRGLTHGLIGLTHGSTPTHLGDIVQWFKTMSTNEYMNNVKNNNWQPFAKHLWQRNYYEHIIRNEQELNKIREYIKTNPKMWERDRNNPATP